MDFQRVHFECRIILFLSRNGRKVEFWQRILKMYLNFENKHKFPNCIIVHNTSDKKQLLNNQLNTFNFFNFFDSLPLS